MLHNTKTKKSEGCVAAFKFPNSTGWVGFFMLQEQVRGLGLGRKLWKGLERSYEVNGTEIIGLDGVQEQVKTYERRGYQDCARIHLMVRPSLLEKPLLGEELSIGAGVQVVDLKTANVTSIAELDLANTGLDRSALWTRNALFDRDDAYGYALISTRHHPNLDGFVLVRQCEYGYRFGPLYAKTYDQARFLLHKAMSHISNSTGSLIAEVFGSNLQGQKVFEELGWNYAGLDYHRMWLNGKVPKEQQEGGTGTKSMFAIFDAAEG